MKCKKIILCILAAVLILGLAGCGKKGKIKYTENGKDHYITYNEAYRNFEKYELKEIECDVTILSVTLPDLYKDLSIDSMSFYDIYAYVGDNEDNIVKLWPDCDGMWNIKKGDKIRIYGHFSENNASYNGITNVPIAFVEVNLCKFLN